MAHDKFERKTELQAYKQTKNNFKPSEISEDVPVRLGREMVGPIYQ